MDNASDFLHKSEFTRRAATGARQKQAASQRKALDGRPCRGAGIHALYMMYMMYKACVYSWLRIRVSPPNDPWGSVRRPTVAGQELTTRTRQAHQCRYEYGCNGGNLPPFEAAAGSLRGPRSAPVAAYAGGGRAGSGAC
eukprot:scaffold1666_cov424-Prasinococcus_capsulatus_cf.AAC.14